MAWLRAAIDNDDLETVVWLLKRGAYHGQPPSFGASALTGGAYRGCRCILLLVQHSANPDLEDTVGGTALMLNSDGEDTTPLQLPGERDHQLCRSDHRRPHTHTP